MEFSHSESEFGWNLKNDLCEIHFGKRNFSFNHLLHNYSENLSLMRQIHGSKITTANRTQRPIADGLLTNKNGLNIAIATADCLPIFFIATRPKSLIAVHAGWRGIASRIHVKAIKQLLTLGVKAKNIAVIVGPHIHQSSFEVDSSTAAKILNNFDTVYDHAVTHISDQKYLISLKDILIEDIKKFNVSPNEVTIVGPDTKSYSDLNSYRRDKENSGRQFSIGKLL